MLEPVNSRNAKDKRINHCASSQTNRMTNSACQYSLLLHSSYTDMEQQRITKLIMKNRSAFSKSSSYHVPGATAALDLLRRIALVCPESVGAFLPIKDDLTGT